MSLSLEDFERSGRKLGVESEQMGSGFDQEAAVSRDAPGYYIGKVFAWPIRGGDVLQLRLPTSLEIALVASGVGVWTLVD